MEALLHDELAATFGGRVGYVLSRQAFRRFRRRVDYSEYGGAPLVGLNGLCIVGHGRSSAKAVANAVTMAVRAVHEDLLGRLSRDVARIAASPMTPPIADPRSPTSVSTLDDCIRISRTGRAESRHGAVARRGVSDLPRHLRRSRRGARRVAEHALLRGARRSPDADGEHAAGDSRDEHRRRAAGGVARRPRRASPPGTASASIRRTSRPVRYPSRMRCAR